MSENDVIRRCMKVLREASENEYVEEEELELEDEEMEEGHHMMDEDEDDDLYTDDFMVFDDEEGGKLKLYTLDDGRVRMSLGDKEFTPSDEDVIRICDFLQKKQ